MSVFAVHDKDPKFIFIINFKVMYSSLSSILPEHFPSVKFYNKAQVAKAKSKLKNYPKFAIVRNPFDRSVSAFYGKSKKNPTSCLRSESAQLQYCQIQLLNTIKELRNEDFENAQPAIFYNYKEHPKERKLLDMNYEKLISISFEEYVNCMAIILKRREVDGHFRTQSELFSIPNRIRFFSSYNVFNNTKIFKLENIEHDWELICKELGKNMALLKVNKTDHLRPSYQSFYTDETRKVIADLYKNDFINFGYSTQF